jgi:hypothetical protein
MEPITITLPGWNQISSYFFPPESTDDTIVFPYSSGSQKFSRTVDSTKVTQGKASLEDINNVLTVFELVISKVSSTRRFLLGLVCLFYFPYFMLNQAHWVYYELSLSLRMYYLIFALPAVTYFIFKRMRETGRRKDNIKKMIEMIRSAYAKRGLRWHFTESFFCTWLELKKEGSTEEQNNNISVEVHPDNSEESLISEQGSHSRVFEELKDGENIIVCAGKNLSGPDSSPPVQWRYVICFIVYGWMMISWINSEYSYIRYYNNRYNRYYY